MKTNFTNTICLKTVKTSGKANRPLRAVKTLAFVSSMITLLALAGCGGGGTNDSKLAHVEEGRYMLLQRGETDTATISKGEGRLLAIEVSETELGMDIVTGDCNPISSSCESWNVTPTINAIQGGYRIGVSDVIAATADTLRADDYFNVSVLPATPAPAGKLISMSLNTSPGSNSISAGLNHSLLIANDGSLWGWGSHEDRKLATNRIAAKQRDPVPAPVRNLTNITQVAAGYRHSLAVKSDGTVLAFGFNGLGQLGDTTTINRDNPVSVEGLNNVDHVAAGRYHSLALVNSTTGNQVYAWGSNSNGQLGIGEPIESPKWSDQKDTPVLVSISNIVQVAASAEYSLALDATGEVWFWGNLVVNRDDPSLYTPIKIKGLSNVVRVAAGGSHVLALSATGTVFAWGSNSYGQLGQGDQQSSELTPLQVTGLTNIIDIAAASSFSMALNASGQVFTWGSGIGQLGRAGDTSLPGVVTLNASVSDIEAGGDQAFAMVADCNGGVTVRSWGSNTYGQLGDGTFTQKKIPSIVIGIGEQDASCDKRVLFYKTGLNPVDANVQGNNMLCNTDLCWEMVNTNVTAQLPISIQYSGTETGYQGLTWDCLGYDGSSQFNLPVTDDIYCKLINQPASVSSDNNSNSGNNSEYTLTVVIQGGPGAGQVNSDELPIPQLQCINSNEETTTCTTTYPIGSPVSLLGEAFGSANLSWSGCTPGFEPLFERPACLLTMDSDRAVTATFSPL